MTKSLSGNGVVIGLALIGVLAGALIASLFISEFLLIVVIANPKTVAAYHFGSEAMRSHGGWRYATAGIYAWSSLFEAILLLSVAALFAVAARRRSIRSTVIGYATGMRWFAGMWLRAF
jgi:hypothetical protein